MSEEEMRKKMEFIVEQQAQFTVDIQQLKELAAQADARMTRLENVVVRFANDTESRFSVLLDAQTRAEQRMAVLADSQAALAGSQSRTDERLNTLINVVERYISEGRDGKS